MKIQIKETTKQFNPFAVEILFENLKEAKETAGLLKSVLEDVDIDLGNKLDSLFTNVKQKVETYIKQFES